ncbi:hypothetical protein FOCC_FOCC010842 [Frankliniella occidentalis]|nr:hypothetical protein FOCC_FOCC010842 [Frankliniella occidentalis]
MAGPVLTAELDTRDPSRSPNATTPWPLLAVSSASPPLFCLLLRAKDALSEDVASGLSLRAFPDDDPDPEELKPTRRSMPPVAMSGEKPADGPGYDSALPSVREDCDEDAELPRSSPKTEARDCSSASADDEDEPKPVPESDAAMLGSLSCCAPLPEAEKDEPKAAPESDEAMLGSLSCCTALPDDEKDAPEPEGTADEPVLRGLPLSMLSTVDGKVMGEALPALYEPPDEKDDLPPEPKLPPEPETLLEGAAAAELDELAAL